MISRPMIQFGEIAEVMFQLFSHLDYGRSCLLKSPNGSVKLEYFPDCSCLGMALQESIEEGCNAEYPTDDCSIHPDYCQALHNLPGPVLSTYVGYAGRQGGEYSVGAKTLQTSSQCWRQDPSNIVAAILRCPLHQRPLRRRPSARRPPRRRPCQWRAKEPAGAQVANKSCCA